MKWDPPPVQPGFRSDQLLPASLQARICPRCRGVMTLSRHHPLLTSAARPVGASSKYEFAWVCGTPWCDCCELLETV